MLSIGELARALMAVIQPATGDRSSGTITLRALDEPTDLPRGHYLLPVVRGTLRSDLVLKVAEGPNEDGSWTIEPEGTAVGVVSNVGGESGNIVEQTRVVLDPPLEGLEPYGVIDEPGLVGGTNPEFLGGVRSVAFYETFGGPELGLDLFRAKIKNFPAVIVVWMGSQPADGNTTPQTIRQTRLGNDASLYVELFQLYVISSRTDSDKLRREEGTRILDRLTALLTDRHSVDGCPFSNPSGVTVRERFRESGQGQALFQAFYVYGLRLSIEQAYHREDDREYDYWLTSRLTLTTPDNREPFQGPYSVVDDIAFDMIHTGFTDGFSDGFG